MNLRAEISKIIPRFQQYLTDIYRYQFDYQLAGVKVFSEEEKADVFLSGKLINACSHVLSNVTGPEKEDFMNKFPTFLKMALQMPCATWGMLNFCFGLHRLKKCGLYDQLISKEEEEKIKSIIDWRKFVREDDLSLINLPTNYYGVAFAVAKYREIFGFESPGYSDKLLAHLLLHIKAYSGDYKFMDETAGLGRYDRYSCLIPGELAAHFVNFEMPLDPFIADMLKASARIYLDLGNNHGHGFIYGRSIGCYGDTSALEVLSAAALTKVLTKEETLYSYYYALAIARKYNSFWIDSDMNSLNMWEKGRRTDSYRFKTRLLGENFSTGSQLLTTLEYFSLLGYDQTEVSEQDLKEKLAVKEKLHLYRFADHPLPRAMAVIGLAGRIYQLPLINGATNYFDKSPYYPTFQTPLQFEQSADQQLPLMWPYFTLNDGSIIAPIVNYHDISVSEQSLTFRIEPFCKIEYLDVSGADLSRQKKSEPVNVDGFKSVATYQFKDDTIDFLLKTEGPEPIKAGYFIIGLFTPVTLISASQFITSDYRFKGENIRLTVHDADAFDRRYHTNHGRYQQIVTATIINPNLPYSYRIELNWRADNKKM